MEKPKSKKPLIYALVIVLILLIGGIVYFFAQSNNSNNNKSAATSSTPSPTQTATPTTTTTSTPTSTATITPTSTLQPSPTTSATPIPSTVPTLAESIQVKVMYSVGDDPIDPADKNSTTDFAYVEYRLFRTKRGDTENFVMEKMIEGPSQADKDTYQWFTPFKLTGESNCDGKDFTIIKDTTANSITVQLCKIQESAGTGSDAQVTSVIRGGMGQFLSEEMTKKIIILDKNGNCFGDQSGLNKCKS